MLSGISGPPNKKLKQSEVCEQFSAKGLSAMNPRDVLKLTNKSDCWHALTIALARLVAAKPHSADVERLIHTIN